MSLSLLFLTSPVRRSSSCSLFYCLFSRHTNPLDDANHYLKKLC
jgi:hypothetical protein